MAPFVPPEGEVVPREKLSLVWYCVPRIRRGVGEALVFAALKYGGAYYPARALSRRFGERFIPLGKRWVRRETLESLGLGPLGRFAGGEEVTPQKVKAPDLLSRGGEALEGACTGFEFKDPRWVVSAPPERILAAHLDFLKGYGISGGVFTRGGEGAAAALGAWLCSLPADLEDGRALVFMGREDYGARFCRFLGGGRFTEGDALFSPQFRGLGFCFYEDIPQNLGPLKPQCDILIFIEPPDAREAGYIEGLKKIKTRLRLGVFTRSGDQDGLGSGARGAKLREFFFLRGALHRLEKQVIRDEEGSLRMPPRYCFRSRRLRRPPVPFAADEEELARQGIAPDAVFISGGARFVIQSKFKNLNIPELKEEQEWFPFNGTEASYTAFSIRRDSGLDFNRLEPEQRDYFFWWRGEFRRGNPRKTCPGYIFLYARELILSLGREAPQDNFRELLGLWRIYREEEAELDACLLPWLMDFAVLYRIWDEALPGMQPRPGEPALALIRDIFLHKRYIEGDHPLTFSDFAPLLPPNLRNGPFLTGSLGPVPEEAAERALRGIDGFLRKTYGERLLEFFYPPRTEPVLFPAFKNLYGAGTSSYSVEWISFYNHRPLLDFLETLVFYIEYRLKEGLGFKKEGKEPVLDAVWKDIIDRELGFEPGKTPGGGGAGARWLEPERVARLRGESDEVRELLRIDEEPSGTAAVPGCRELPPPGSDLPPVPKPERGPVLADFLAGLDTAPRELLRLLAGNGDGEAKTAALKELAKTALSMPDFLIDGINGQFQEAFEDILIEARDGENRITAEYEKDIREYFTLTGGDT